MLLNTGNRMIAGLLEQNLKGTDMSSKQFLVVTFTIMVLLTGSVMYWAVRDLRVELTQKYYWEKVWTEHVKNDAELCRRYQELYKSPDRVVKLDALCGVTK